MSKKYPISRDEYIFYRDHRRDIVDVQMFADILDALRRGHFQYDTPITLAELLNFSSDKTNSHYHEFYIKKKKGGKRLICAPDDRLKEIQNCIRYFLTGPYYKGSSIVSKASPHIGKEVVYNFDIKDFYPSINAAQIIQKLLEKGYKYDVAELLASLVTMRSREGLPILPQGSPSSPVIADLVVEHLDSRLSGFARKHGISCTRYVDDITFSCSKSEPWTIYSGYIKKIISTEGFKVNEKKCHVSFNYQRQEVLGLTVNTRLNVSTKYIKQLRTIIHNWEKDGYIKANNKLMMHYFKDAINPRTKIPRMECIVAGKLSYLKMVRNAKIEINSYFSTEANPFDFENYVEPSKNKVDPVWEKLHNQYVALLKRDYPIITGKACNRLEKKIFKYGDDIGPLCLAVREDANSPWKIKKIYYEDGWRNGDENTAHHLRYGKSLPDPW